MLTSDMEASVGDGPSESGGTISSGTPRFPRTQVYHLCQTGLRGDGMPYLAM